MRSMDRSTLFKQGSLCIYWTQKPPSHVWVTNHSQIQTLDARSVEALLEFIMVLSAFF